MDSLPYPRLTVPTLTEQVVKEIAAIGELRKPNEACGVLLMRHRNGSQVVELPNRSLEPGMYRIDASDIRIALVDWFRTQAVEDRSFAVWHTHPEGNIGPSRGDMINKPKGATFLVVALTESGPVANYF